MRLGVSPEPTAQADLCPLTGKRAVVLAANDHARQAYQIALEEAGLLVTALDSALVAADQLATLPAADLLVVDVACHNPRELDLLAWLNDRSSSHTPTLALVAADQTEHQKRCRELAVEQCISKPALADEFLVAVRAAIGTEWGDAANEPQPAADLVSRPQKILVADDSPVNQVVAEGLLKLRGYDVTIVPQGARPSRLANKRRSTPF